MRKTLTKQIVSTSTKSQFSHEEARINASDSNNSVDFVIILAHQWKMAHGQALVKEIKTAHSTIFCIPIYSAK
jgi:hypothetical protein